MKEIERKIFVDSDILLNEYEYVYGKLKDNHCKFVYYNVKKDRESSGIFMTYSECLSLARSRANDGRYKNYEFLISIN